jgi:LysR family transcriptional regulator, hca operon transcriptional activator
MDIKKLVTFINLVETQNFTRTAKAMHVTQPTVTHDINAIENEIDTKLFNRNKRYVNVTENGWLFYKKIRPLINNYYSAIQDIQKHDLIENSQIRLGYSYSLFNDLYIPKWINKFQKKFPQIKFIIENLNHNELKQYLLDNKLDLMITTGKEVEDLSDIKQYLIEMESFKAIVPKRNPLSRKKILNLKDFQAQNMLFLDSNWAAVDLIKLQNEIIRLNNPIDITYANDLSSLNILIKSGQGIAVGLYCIYAELEDTLSYVSLDWKPTVDLVIITPHNQQKRIVYNFIKFVQNYKLHNNE